GRDGIHSFDLVTGKRRSVLKHPQQQLSDFDFAPDGRTLIVRSGLGDMELVDLESGTRSPVERPAPPHPASNPVWGARWAPVASQFDAVVAWDRASGAFRDWQVPCFRPWLMCALSSAAPVFAAVNPQLELTLYSFNTGEAIRTLNFAVGSSTVRCITFSPD